MSYVHLVVYLPDISSIALTVRFVIGLVFVVALLKVIKVVIP